VSGPTPATLAQASDDSRPDVWTQLAALCMKSPRCQEVLLEQLVQHQADLVKAHRRIAELEDRLAIFEGRRTPVRGMSCSSFAVECFQDI